MTLLLALLACGDPERAFARDVVPALERGCASALCHGVGPGAEARGEVLADGVFAFPVDEHDRITDVAAARRAALAKITTVEDPEHSTLLRKPLDPAYGGFAHLGGASWASPEHPDYQLVKAWIALEAAGGEDAPELDAHEQAFADDVQAPLVAMGCLGGACHSPASGVPFRLDTGIDGAIGRAGTRANLTAARAMLSLDGDPLQSRLLRKMLPLHDGGIAHRGGNRSFLTGLDDGRLAPIVAWIAEERRLRLGDASPAVTGIVFVRGPVAAEDPFDLDVYAPGTDLWIADLSADGLVTGERPLTEALHDGPADLRDPAVDDAGARVAFAMRASPDGGHAIWVLDLASGLAEQVTSPTGATDRDPTWGPDGAIWFVSTRAGAVADAGDRLDGDLYRLDLATREVTRRTWTPHIERDPVFFVHGEEAGGEIGFTALREVSPSQRRAHPFRFPPGLATEYHQHFGITPPEDLFFDMRELPDGRYVTVVGDLTGVWGGRLGVVDRNFGPELQDAEPGIPGYLPPLSRLDPESASSGVTNSLYRDPVALPDGSILAAWAPGPLDLADAAAPPPDLRIVRITLDEASGAAIADRDVIIDAPGTSDRDPEPVYAREPAPLTPSATSGATTALLRHQGVASIDALLGALQPGGVKPIRDDVVAVRIIESLPVGPDVRRPIPASETLHDVDGATTTSLSPHGPARVLAEIPVEEDGSFQIQLPAQIAVRLQLLDARGMRVGTSHNRWLDLAPGQTLNQGVPTAVYRTTCAICHGALDGDPAEVYPEPDILTSASLTLARYHDQDPRLPRDPVVPGAPIAADFRSTVRPILDARCAACHDAASALDLGAEPTIWFDVAYEALSDGWIDGSEGSARASPLLEVLLGAELDAPGAAPSAPHGGATDAEVRAIARWIESGASWSAP